MDTGLILLFILPIGLSICLALLFKFFVHRRRRKSSIAFFHLYCVSGGGGERVLWHTIQALFREYPHYSIYIYSHRDVKSEDKQRILLKVRDLFKIDLISNPRIVGQLEFVALLGSPLVEAKRYPFLTLLGQSFGSILVALEAAYRVTPEVYVETIGFSFTLPIFKLLSCKVATYVHYPTISSDMINNVKTSTHASFNNRGLFVRYPIFRNLKLFYYQILAALYGFSGRQADLVLVNSSWTKSHINSLWSISAHVVYPPCDIENFKEINSKRDPSPSKQNVLNVISVAQFRPEKNHQLQIEAFDLFLRKTGAYDSRLSLYGGCRDEDDKKRVRQLNELIQTLDLTSNVEIIVGAPFDHLIEGMRQAEVAIHTMENEHFGIVLVECMAAGLITIAHNSGGPKTDIIDNNVSGLLATNAMEFTEKLVQVSKMEPEQRRSMSAEAIKKSEQFSAKSFEDQFTHLIGKFLN